MRKRCTIGATLIAIAILGTLLITNNKIRSPALAKVTVTALAEENGFDERDVKPVKEKSSGKKTSWTTALLWLIFIAGVIDVVFLKKDSTISNNSVESNAAANTTENNAVANTTESNATVNTNSAGGGDTNAEL